MANKYREIEEVAAAGSTTGELREMKKKVTAKKPARKGVLARGLASVFSGTFLTSDKTLKHLPFVLFLAVIAVMYIANGYYADNKVRQAHQLTNQLKELRSEYISTKSELMFTSKQSELAKAAAELELKEPVVPPIKILVDSVLLYGGK